MANSYSKDLLLGIIVLLVQFIIVFIFSDFWVFRSYIDMEWKADILALCLALASVIFSVYLWDELKK